MYRNRVRQLDPDYNIFSASTVLCLIKVLLQLTCIQNLTISCLFKQLILPPSTSRLDIVPKKLVQKRPYTVELMSSRRRRRATSFTDAELNGLVLKLQALLPDSSSSCTTKVCYHPKYFICHITWMVKNVVSLEKQGYKLGLKHHENY